MQLARVKLDTTAPCCTEAGLILCGLSLHVNGLNFPSPEWVDFPIVVLGWWTEAVIPLLRGSAEPVQARFMEGPYVIEFRVRTAEIWHMDLVKRGLSRSILYSADIDVETFLNSLIDACDCAIDMCHRQGFWSSDADNLAKAAGSLREEIKTFKKKPM
ncbi:hypothetical protein [Nitrosomonas sp.]|uniref:hypothetical protein n=1 Tax=Nitrosomonas sp. TaxID=42353 RepID=UPI0025EC7F94|nr:hypothetical protein [Nitrosomonas sp.]MBV6447994.1 hypothetical protein [Nitrosomonas sp.]